MKKQITYIVILAGMIGIIFFISKPRSDATSIIIESKPEVEELSVSLVEEESPTLYYIVDVKGEVKFPGIYELESYSRIHDVIQLAGGFTEDANEQVINLAEKIKDEMVIYVPNLSEEYTLNWKSISTSDSTKISINQASEAQLQSLPGIGSTKAAAIVEYRTKNGSFKSIDELKKVTGIGEKTFESLEEFIEL